MLKVACIPAYNEGGIIGEIVRKSVKYVDKVIVCDDGSKDETYHEAKSAGAIVIRHDKNIGKGAALKSLFEKSKEISPDVIVTLDGDGQFLPSEIPKIIQPILDGNADIVIGNRFRNNKKEIPKYRRVGNKILDKFASMASELPFEDTQSGFRGYSKKAIDLIRFSSKGFAADAEILIDASKKDLRIVEESVSVLYDTGRKTSTKKPISHFSEVSGTLIQLVAIRHPLRYLGMPGLVLIILGIIYSIVVITIFNETRYFSVPSTLIALGSLVTGLILMLVSVILYAIGNILKRVE